MNVIAFLAALLPFAIAMSFTPGPNNLMLASSGARFGFVRTLPHLAGIVIGFAVMTLGVGLGLAALITAVPALYLAMRVASILYMLWMAWQIATAEGGKSAPGKAQPMSFLAAAAFQWINPKAWIITLTAVATYTTLKSALWPQIVLMTGVFAVVGVASCSTWLVFGQFIRRYLTSPRRRILFNWTMALLLVGSIVPVLLEHRQATIGPAPAPTGPQPAG